MVHSFGASYKNVRLRPLEHRDIEYLRKWRNDAERNEYLRKIPHITPEMQEKWFEGYLENKDIVTFAIDETNEMNQIIGSVSLYNFRGDIAECGQYMVGANPRVRGKGLGRMGMILCLHVGFTQLNLRAIDASVHEDNIAALTSDTKAGFCIVGEHPYVDGKKEWEMIAEPEHFRSLHSFWQEIIDEQDI